MTNLYGTTAYAVTYGNGKTETLYAFDLEGAEYIALNLSSLYGRGGVASLAVTA